MILEYILYIYNPFYFQKNKNRAKVLTNCDSEINTIISNYSLKLSF